MRYRDHPAKGNAMQSAPDLMMQMITGHWMTQIVHAAATYSLADELADGPATAGDIAARLSTDPDATFRLLRAVSVSVWPRSMPMDVSRRPTCSARWCRTRRARCAHGARGTVGGY
jgi:hypothetical protein